MASWLVGLPTLAAAVWAWSRLNTEADNRIALSGLISFAPLFVWESLRGGWDVVSRTLTVNMRIDPGFLDFKTRLRTTASRTFFVNCVGLLPGTLAADIHDDRLEIHTLDRSGLQESDLRRLEASVARLLPQGGSGE